VLSLGVEVTASSGVVAEYSGLGFHPRHARYAGLVLGPTPPSTADALTNPIVLQVGANLTAFTLVSGLLGTAAERVVALTGGSDGTGAPSDGDYTVALNRLLALEDVSIVAAPGASAFAAPTPAAVNQLLIGHAEARRAYRIAVLDTPPALEPGDVRTLKSLIDSKYAALYYPWVRISNPLAATDPTQAREIHLPPSGFVCGIYARSDIQRGVFKAPANETVTGALGLQRDVRFGEQEVLNPLGINCIRALPNRGIRVWGARTLSSDPEWKYVNVRRYFLYLEASIDRGTQWAVFEPNGERLWANVRTTVTDFLYNEWVGGALLGVTPKEAFFVRCDRSTMTQNDLDNGRLICLVGVAALKPAEFVIFRIGQKTADSRD
jgi:phage tail sheath protein FI